MLLLLLTAAGCGARQGEPPVPVVDLLARFANAEHRPSGGTFELREHTFGGRARASLIVPSDSRIIWTLFVPHRGRLTLFAGVPDTNGPAAATVRIGISDVRSYVTLVEQRVTTEDTSRGWVPIAADLSAYAGRQWSLFFRPDRRRWQIILATHAVSGSPGVVYLAEPQIVTDREGAREYMKRQTAPAPRS